MWNQIVDEYARSTHQEQFLWQIAAVVDASIHRDELFRRGLVLHARIVKRRVQHDDGEAEHVASVRVCEDIGIELAVALGETLHHAVDLLRLAGQPETPEELSKIKKKFDKQNKT